MENHKEDIVLQIMTKCYKMEIERLKKREKEENIDYSEKKKRITHYYKELGYITPKKRKIK